MTILITGGTGLIGKALTKALLEKDHHVIILTRDSEKLTRSTGRVRYANWDVDEENIDADAIADADHIIHLAGAGIADKRWTKKRKVEIVNSRVEGSKLIIDSLKSIPNRIKSVISASAIGWYGEDPPAISKDRSIRGFEESDPPAEGFLGQTCKAWEESIRPVKKSGKRLVIFRNGIVLSMDGGALPALIKPLRFGLAPIVASGKQRMSWIHIDDLVRLYITAIENEKFSGVYNAVSPSPVLNKQLMIELAKLKRGKYFIPFHVPAFILKLMIGEVSIELLKSSTVSCGKLHFEGFTFQYPSIESALQELLNEPAKNHIEN